MAHSDIFPCGRSNDAMLATKAYSVIRERRVVKSCSLRLRTPLLRKEKSSYSLVGSVHWFMACQRKGIYQCNSAWSDREKSIQQTQVAKRIRNAALCSMSCSPLVFLCCFLYPITFFFSQAISCSHTWTYINVTATQSTQRACLWETSGHRRHFHVQLQLSARRQWLLKLNINLFKWSSLFVSGRTTPLDQKTHCGIMWIDPLGLWVPIFTLSVLTHCLDPLPLKQTTKTYC